MLNLEGITTRKGRKFLIQYVHRILTNEAYVTRHYFNLRDSRTKKLKPKECWIALKTPRIVSDIEFNAVRDRLNHNHPLRTAPRIVNSNILLTGLVHCSYCNSRMKIQTGKSGAYKYYKCAKRADGGNAVCTGCSMRMEKLDDLVMNSVLDRTLAPNRLDELLTPLVERANDRQKLHRDKIRSLKSDKREIKNQLDVLWQQIGAKDLQLDASLKSYIEKMQRKYENILRAISRLEFQNSTPLTKFSSSQKHSFSSELRTRLSCKEQPKFRKSYLKSLLSRIEVSEDSIKITGSNMALANLASNFVQAKKLVPTFEQEWRTRGDSNA